MPAPRSTNRHMIRVISIALAFVALTLVLLPSQLIGMAFDLRLQRTVPHLYHRILCALIGVRIRQIGRRSAASPVLILSNHVSWLDISVISALAPVVFVAKSEVAGWPVLGWLEHCSEPSSSTGGLVIRSAPRPGKSPIDCS